VVESFSKRYVPGGAGEGIGRVVADGADVAAPVWSAGTDAQAIGAGVVTGGSGGNVDVAGGTLVEGAGDTLSGAHATVAIARRIAARLTAPNYHTRQGWFAPVSAGLQFAFRPLHGCMERERRRLK